MVDLRNSASRLACLALTAGLGMAGGSLAVTAAKAQTAQAEQSYQLAAQPFAQAINAIARTAGVSVVIEGPMAGLRAAPVSGSMSLDTALMTALSGTGARWRMAGPSSLVVTVPEVSSMEGGGDMIMLDPIVVTAGGFAQQILDAPASITVIGAEQLESRSFNNVTDVLRDVPGVSIDTGSGSKLGAPVITMRGMGESYVLVMVDGKPLGDSQDAWYNGWGNGAKSNMLPSASSIERIEVIRGPMSSLYGSAALGGVINVITKPVDSIWSGSVTAEATVPTDDDEGMGRQLRFNLSGPLVEDKLGLMLTGTLFDRETDTILNGIPEHDRTSLGARLTWKIDETQDLSFDIQSTQQNNTARADETLAAGSAESTADSDHLSYGLTHNITWANGAETTSYLIREELDIANGTLESSYAKTEMNTLTSLFLTDHTLTFGGNYRIEETLHDASRFTGADMNDMERWHAALFLEDEWLITDDFSLTLGMRYDENERYGSNFSPRIYGVWHATPDLTVKGGISTGFKVPALKQADTNIVEPAGRGAGWDQGNTDLKPESSTNYEIGLMWQAPQGFMFGVTAYHTKFEDMISKEYICGFSGADMTTCVDPAGSSETRSWIQQYVNVASATVEGLEASFDYALGDVEIGAAYTYAKRTDDTTGERLKTLPEHVLNLRLDWQATEALGLWTTARYRSETEEGRNPATVEAYTTVDVGMNYRFNDRVTGFAGVSNLFDKTVETYNPSTGDLVDGKIIDGQAVFFGLTANF